MHNRWCIISGPRTGSTWLERMIYQYWKNIDNNALNLDEISDVQIGTEFSLCLDSNGYLYKNNIPITAPSSRYLMDRTIELLNKTNKDQPLTLKVFTQWRNASDNDYFYFLTSLQKFNFKFINLNRILFDKVLSFYFMKKTGIVHKFINNDSTLYSKMSGAYTSETNPTKIDIDFTSFDELYKMVEGDVILQNNLCKQLQTVPINYETMIEDCVWENIPHSFRATIDTDTPTYYVTKLYEQHYKSMITEDSWKKLVDNYKKHSIENTACQFAWDYPVLNLSRNELRNCCRAKATQISETDFKKGKDLFVQATPIKKAKKELLYGIKTSACNSCWKIEEANGVSQRSGFNSFVGYVKAHLWKELSIQEIEEKLKYLSVDEVNELTDKMSDIRMIELSLGNTCDLKCVYCNHHYSSQWATEKLKYKEIKIEHLESELPKIKNTMYEDIFWDWFENISGHTTRYINFIGGEPLLIDKFYDYTKRILDFYGTTSTNKNKVCLGVVTNFNSQPKYFEKFKELSMEIIQSKTVFMEINISAESIGKKTEFIRNGLNWEKFSNNFENYLAFLNDVDPDDDPNDFYKQKICVGVQIAINSLSVSDLPNYIRYIISLQKKFNRRIGLRQNQVVFPEWCNPHILTEDYNKYIDEAIEVVNSMDQFKSTLYPEYGKWSNYTKFLQNIKSMILNQNKNVQARKQFVHNIDKLSERRKLNFHETFPEMVDFYNLCKKIN